jgi:hypothetical protein
LPAPSYFEGEVSEGAAEAPSEAQRGVGFALAQMMMTSTPSA